MNEPPDMNPTTPDSGGSYEASPSAESRILFSISLFALVCAALVVVVYVLR